MTSAADSMIAAPRRPRTQREIARRCRALRKDILAAGETRWASPPPGASWRRAARLLLLQSFAFALVMRSQGYFGEVDQAIKNTIAALARLLENFGG